MVRGANYLFHLPSGQNSIVFILLREIQRFHSLSKVVVFTDTGKKLEILIKKDWASNVSIHTVKQKAIWAELVSQWGSELQLPDI